MRLAPIVAALIFAAVPLSAKDLTLPDPSLTPGVARALTLMTICTTKWGKDARHVTAAMKKQVFENYGLSGNDDAACLTDASGRHCEIDHLISRELGGADDIKNLWPEPYGSSPWNAVKKDRVENRLHKEVCAKSISLSQARKEIKTDWRVPYRRYFGHP
jgi:hypothetical protein